MSDTRTVIWTLPADVLSGLEDLAAIDGGSIQEIASELLRQSVDQAVSRGHGRCSLRTGLHSEGPRPLPLQQP